MLRKKIQWANCATTVQISILKTVYCAIALQFAFHGIAPLWLWITRTKMVAAGGLVLRVGILEHALDEAHAGFATRCCV
jgi:hypothetical protein